MANKTRLPILLILLLLGCWPAPEVWAAKKKRLPVMQEVIHNPEVYLAAPPQFLRPDGEKFYLAIDVPYDLFYLDNGFYLLYRGAWFASDCFEGPWEKLGKERTPLVLRSSTPQKISETRKQTMQKFEQSKLNWPPEALFIPETIDSDALGMDDTTDADMVQSGNNQQQETD